RSLGCDCRRRNAVDADPITTQFTSEPASQSNYGRFRRGVVQGIRHAVNSGERCNVDDAPTAALAHRRHYGFAAVPDALDVDSHGGIPFILCDGIKTASVQGPIKRGIVHEAINPAEFALSGLG